MQSISPRIVASLAALTIAFATPTAAQTTTAQTTTTLPTGQQAQISTTAPLPAAIEVTRAKTGHLLVPVSVNGQPAGKFILDTGAGMSCIDKAVAAKLNLSAAGQATASGNAGSVAAAFRKTDSLAFGPVTVQNTLLVELDLAPIAAALGEPIGGVIGFECFYAGIFEIDPAAPSVTLHDKSPEHTSAHWQPMTLTGRRPHLPGQIEDHPPGEFLIDLGANSGLTISAPLVAKYNLTADRPTSTASTGGVGGTQPALKGTIKSLRLADQSLTDVPATFSQATKGLLASDQNLGAIGVGVLSKYRLFLDYQQSRIALLPKPAP